MPTAEVVERLAAADVPARRSPALDEVATDPQVVASGTVAELDHAVLGPMRQPRPAPVVDGEPSPLAAARAELGEHTTDVLHDAGLDDDEIAALIKSGAVGGSRTQGHRFAAPSHERREVQPELPAEERKPRPAWLGGTQLHQPAWPGN